MAHAHEPIAVVGMACRFPGGITTPESYWSALLTGEPVRSGRAGEGLLLDDVDGFDAAFFGLTPTEAAAMDPQHRLFLEVAWEALERAGQAPDRLAGSNTAVYLGLISPDYLHRQFQADPARLSPYAFTGNMLSMAPGRLSYLLDLRGPALAVESACSSSLLAVHQAVRQLRGGESDLALAGGANLVLLPELTTVLDNMGALSSDGRSRTFEADADGYGRAEGCGMVVLKRLSDAEAAGDTVLAVIRGSAVNQDGRSNGITVPSGRAQAEVITAALADACLAPEDVGYVECHGTGTAVGDPIEVAAVDSVLGGGSLRLGSAKAVIGHAEAAAGVAGLIKAVLCVRHGVIPGQPVRELNPALAAVGAEISLSTVEWQGRRVAGVSAFGFSGTNVHVLVEAPACDAVPARRSRPDAAVPQDSVQPPTPPAPVPVAPASVLTVSASTESALRALAGRYADYLRSPSAAPLADVCHTANTGRARLAWRTAVTASDASEMALLLDEVASGGGSVRRVPRDAAPSVAFLYSGQGTASVGMGRELFETQPVYREAIEEIDAAAGGSVLPLLYPASTDGDGAPITDTAVAQPAVFAVQAALTRLWLSFGVTPAAVAGHSLGEYAAACAAGAMSWREGLRLCVERGRLMAALPADEGAMLAVFATPEEIGHLIGRVEVAAYNGPAEVVLSGPVDAITELASVLGRLGITSRRLPVSHAFHSRLLDPVLDRFEAVAEQVAITNPVLPFAGNLTGAIAEPGELPDSHRWRRHMREPVRYWDGVRALLDIGVTCFVEIGADSTLTDLGQRGAPDSATWLSSLKRKQNDTRQLLSSLGSLHALGVAVSAPGEGRTCALPTYPFERRKLWLDGLHRAARPYRESAGLLGRKVPSPLPQTQYETVLAPEDVADSAGLVHVGVYAELALAASGSSRLVDLEIREALVVDEERTVHTIVDGSAVRVYSQAGDWCEHARASAAAGAPLDGQLDLAEIDGDSRQGSEFYVAMREERGLDLGPSVALIDRLWHVSDRVVLARLSAGPDPSAATGFESGVLDACMQLFNAMVPADEGLMLFMRLGSLDVARAGSGQLWARAEITDKDSAGLRGRVEVFAADGRLVGRAEDVEMRRTRPEVLAVLGREVTGGAVFDGVRGLSAEAARARLLPEVWSSLTRVVGVTSNDLGEEEPLTTVGVDSIMATQLRNAISSRFGVSLALRQVLDGASVATLVSDLAHALTADGHRVDDDTMQAGRV
ncbi:type I polyketide synthase [Allokutzneria albata]|uniref:Acyl transferase domain-containing protein n=1 Tax=Allokutzneria albata TaxID=211114 RepID=A0A1G9UFZ3_ALLAB|nr:type I polyketide synthase [Allokutzneria albata]SDM58841.1 Acyl transferase domain-containing protein [Allokutzneria albata]